MTPANSCPLMGLERFGSRPPVALEGPVGVGLAVGAVKKLRLASMVFPSSV